MKRSDSNQKAELVAPNPSPSLGTAPIVTRHMRDDTTSLFARIRSKLTFLQKANDAKEKEIKDLRQQIIHYESANTTPMTPNDMKSRMNSEFARFIAIQTEMKREIDELHSQQTQREVIHQADIIDIQREHEVMLAAERKKFDAARIRIESLEKEIHEIQHKYKELRRFGEEVVNELESNQLTIQELGNSLHYSQSQNKQLQVAGDRLKGQLSEIPKLKQIISNLNEERKLYKEEIQRLNAQINEDDPSKSTIQVPADETYEASQNANNQYYMMTQPFLERHNERTVRMREFLQTAPIVTVNDNMSDKKIRNRVGNIYTITAVNSLNSESGL